MTVARTMPHLVARAPAGDDRAVAAAQAVAAARAARMDALAVDRRRYRGGAGELLLNRMPAEPRALVVEDHVRRLRDTNTEWRLTTMRRLLARAGDR